MTPYFLAVDGGGTKTLCIIADAEGAILGLGTGGGANANLVPEAVARQSIEDAIKGAWTASRGRRAGSVSGVAISGPMIGYVRDVIVETTGIDAIVRVSEADAAWASVRPWLTRDTDLSQDVAVMVDAGTGATAGGCRGDERAGAGGWGWLLGDEGGGFWIGLQAVQAAIRAGDGRGPATALSEAIRAALDLTTLHALIPLVYKGKEGIRLLAQLSPVVAETARRGDAQAQAILDAAGRELAALVTVTIRRLEIESRIFPVVPFGSVFKAGDVIMAPFRAEVLKVAPHARFILPRYESVVGTLLLAMEEGGVEMQAVWPCLEKELAHHPRLLAHPDALPDRDDELG